MKTCKVPSSGKRGGPVIGGVAGNHIVTTLSSRFNVLIVVHDDMARHAAAIYDHVVGAGARYLPISAALMWAKAAPYSNVTN